MNYVDTEKLRSDIVNGVDAALGKLEYQYEKLSERTAEAKEKTQRFIRENPEKAVLIAAGVGAIAAIITLKIMKRRMMRIDSSCC
ncbi:MAG: hypothetical protein WC831_02995 [Parcubacteria group bacterium]|jgi:ElaB/YqjD/DUF883 family membrane-anchored ribosome-binding protein